MIAIVKYNAGNIRSVENAVHRLGYTVTVTDDPYLLQSAEKVIFPGVGEAASAMRYLSERNLDNLIKNLKQPVLGICLGLQLLCSHSEEGNVECLHVFPNEVKKFTKARIVPHMGWNNLRETDSPLFKGLPPDPDVYFVHSYFATLSGDTIAICQYEEVFSAALARDNFFAVQFHPEKSGKTGARILKNFLEL